VTAFDRTVARVNEIADRDTSDRERLYEYLVAILDTQLADLIRNGELRKSGFTETADLLENTPSLAGRCGDSSPTIPGIWPARCALTAGHAGWHKGDDGSEWHLTDDTTAPR